MSRGTAVVLTGLLVLAVLVSVLVQVWALPFLADQVVSTFPEVKPIVVPSIIWGIVAIFCLQVAAVFGIRVLALARTGKLDASFYRWLRAVVACLILFVVLVVFAWVVLSVLEWATPGVIFGLFVGGALALGAIVPLVRFLRMRPSLSTWRR
jgi:hypothetical protein